MGLRGPKPVDQKGLESWYKLWLGLFEGMRWGRYIRADLRFEPEAELWNQLVEAETPEEIRAVCDKSPFWFNPKHGAILFYRGLSEHADTFLAAKRDSRWPGSKRPTSEGRKIRFLARSMAGIMMGISPRTAQDLFAKMNLGRLDERIYHPVCECGHRERDHSARTRCKYCSCDHYRYSGGRDMEEPLTAPDRSSS